MGVGGYRPRDRRVRREHPAGLVEHPWTPRLPRHRPTIDHRGQRWRQRQPAPHLEDRPCHSGRRDRPGHQRLPPTSGHQQVEQDRAPAVLADHPQLAGQAPDQPRTILQLIGATTTDTGLTVTATLDTGTYPTGIKISDREMAALPITRDDVPGDWNYTLHPTRDTPEPS